MKNHIMKLGLVLAAAMFSQPTWSTEYGCPIGDPAKQLADDYNHQWLNAIESGDATGISKLYSDNAVMMPPTDETIVGNDPIGMYLTTATSGPQIANYSVDIVGCELSGNTLQFAGVWGAEKTDPGGRGIKLTGNLLRILDRQADGSWAMSYEIWN